MTFFDPTPTPEHRCNLPEPDFERGWRCYCGRAYIRETLPDRDVNAYESRYQWRRSPEHDLIDDGRR